MTDPFRACIQQFHTAASSADPRSAAALSTEAGWRSRADSAARLARQISKEHLELRTPGPTFESPTQPRVAVRCELASGDQVLDRLYVLLEQVDGAWKVEGFAQHRTLVGLFLAGQHSPVVALEDLPSDAEAAAWAQAEAERLDDEPSDDPRLVRFAEQGFTEVEVVGVRALEPLSRIGVVLQARRPGQEFGQETMTVLQRVDGELSVHARGLVPSYDALLDGVEASWDVQLSEGSAADRADALLSGLFDQLLGLMGLSEAVPPGGARPLLRFLSAEAQAGRLPMANLLDPGALAGTWGGNLAERIERRVQARIGEILGQHGIDPDALDPDSPAGRALVEEHADDIVRGLFQGVLLASAPADATPPPTDSSPGAARWMRAALRHMADDA